MCVFLVTRDFRLALPRDATGLSAVCFCGISCSYSLTISEVKTIFGDINKTFDRVWHNVLLLKLKFVGSTGSLLG